MIKQIKVNFDLIPDELKYDCFIEIYTRSDFGFELLKDHYENIFSYAHHSSERKERLKKLSEEFEGKESITIFHGVSYDYPVFDYYSWTLNEMTAQWFAYRHSNFGEVLKREIFLTSAVDYLTDRDEAEILYQPTKLFLKMMFKEGE